MTTPVNYQILLDQDGKPIPQYFVPDEGFKPLLGTEDVAPHYILVDVNGNIATGEVQATPTANTILGRLKEIEDAVVGTLDVQLTGSKAENYETLTVSDTIETLTPGANTYGFITVEDAPIRFRVDGGDPSATVGTLLGAGDSLGLDSVEDLANFKAIRRSTTDAVIHVIYSVVA